jgi:ParB family chromosome partitioning protein
MTYAGISDEHADHFNAHTSKPLIIRGLLGRCKQTCQGGKKTGSPLVILNNKDNGMPSERPAVVAMDASRFNMESPSLFWPRTFDQRLLESLEQNGQLVPVLATFDGDVCCLLAGQRRVRALAALNQPVHTLILEDVSPLQRGIIYLESNSSEPLDDGAMIRALRYFASCTRDLDPLAPYLGLSSHGRQWSLVCAWLILPASWDDLLVKGHVPLALTRFDPDDLHILQAYFQDMSWSRNNALHFATWIWEASRMKGCSVGALMNELGLNEILSLDLSPKDAMARMLAAARTGRYPRLCLQEREFRKRSQDVVAGSHWRIDQPDNFETRAVALSTRIASPEDLAQRVEELAHIAQDKVWDHLDPAGEPS